MAVTRPITVPHLPEDVLISVWQAGKINGTVLYPGEEFSVGQTIGPLTAAGGYELAGAYENGQTVQSYGGGVCQVSTTLYNAVLKAELEVTQRSKPFHDRNLCKTIYGCLQLQEITRI